MSIIYEDDLGIKFTQLGYEDIFWGVGTQTVERFGEEYIITEINGANIPFGDGRTLTQVLVEDYPAIEIVAQDIASVVVVATNMDIILSIAEDIVNWRRMTAEASVDTYTSATFDYDLNKMVFTIEQGPIGPEGAQGVQGIDGPQGTAGPTINFKGSDTIASILIRPNVSGDAWLSTDTGTDDEGTAVAVGDLLLSSTTQWINVGLVAGAQGIQGVQGPQGVEGPQGLTGAQGPLGPEGSQGLTGAIGPQGNTGIQGPQGVEGPLGPEGIQGLTGLDGPEGPEGIQGPQGLTGATGPQGIEGPSGPQGLAGLGINILGTDTLANILAKANGTIGDAWLSSDTGIDDDGLAVAIDDVLRDTGTKWINVGGIEGPQGAQGAQGAQGIQGIQGTQGDQGTLGPSGPQGDSGPAGPQGVQGVQGDIGLTGAQGVQGEQGIEGIEGPPISVGTYVEKTDLNASAQFPVGTDAQRDATPLAGMTRYNSDRSDIERYNGADWHTMSAIDITAYSLTADDTISFTGLPSGLSVWAIELEANGWTITWDAAVTWDSDGTEPTWTTGKDLVYFYTLDGGTTIKGMMTREGA